jgi:hypothetical protein
MAKKLKIKLPKRVGGVKIPKSIRKGPIAGFLNSGAGQMVLAEALVAAAGAFTASRTSPGTKAGELVRHPLEGSRRAGHAATKAGAEQAAHLSFALQEAARAFRVAMEEGPPEDGSWSAPEDADAEPVAKKKHSSRNDTTVPH